MYYNIRKPVTDFSFGRGLPAHAGIPLFPREVFPGKRLPSFPTTFPFVVLSNSKGSLTHPPNPGSGEEDR